MLVFNVYHDGQPAEEINLAGANLTGSEGAPIRAEIAATDGQITCLKKAGGAATLMVLWKAGDAGEMLLETARLPERKDAYNLNLELARGRVAALIRKREDWGLIGFSSGQVLADRFAEVRRDFVGAVKLNTDDPAAASVLADTCLAECVSLSEQTAAFHANIFLVRRRKLNKGRPTFGCEVRLENISPAYEQLVLAMSDFINLPTPWLHAASDEGDEQPPSLDAWIEWCTKHRIPLSAGPLVNFEPGFMPEKLVNAAHDFDTLKELIYKHTHHQVARYADNVATWKVISGANAFNGFNLNFEQIMELTRMTCSLVRSLAPKASIAIELAMPWGEYHATNPRTMPPMMYADMCIQSGIKFDSFGLQVYMGAAADGMYVRDMMQISAKLDEFANFGKPVHITGCEAPSATDPDPRDHWAGKVPVAGGGQWRRPWDEDVQAEWLEHFCRLALSKPFVATVCWRDMADGDNLYMPHGGLCRADLAPKPAYEKIRKFRAALNRRSPNAAHAAPINAASDPGS